MKYALVTTTINVPRNLEAYVKDIADHAPHDTLVVVAGDLKTPVEAQHFCETLTMRYGIVVTYLSPGDQEARYPAYSNFLGWNTIQRRNIAILVAYHAGAGIIATIDDDNFLTSEDYLGQHGDLGVLKEEWTVGSTNGWYNNCRGMHNDRGFNEFYPRGYSVKERGSFDGLRLTSNRMQICTAVNAGLWIGDPDIDAVTRLAINPRVDNVVAKPAVILDPGAYCPFNSQNTALHRDVIPAYCMVSGVGRYDDIIPSFFVKCIADDIGDGIRFGEPVVKQERNAHDLWKDLDGERLGMQLTDRLVDWLRGLRLEGRTYGQCIDELMTRLRERWLSDGSLAAPEVDFVRNVISSYDAWKEVI